MTSSGADEPDYEQLLTIRTVESTLALVFKLDGELNTGSRGKSGSDASAAHVGHGATHAPDRATQVPSVRPRSLKVTCAAFCGTLGALGAHPRADEPYAVLGECQHVRSVAPGTDTRLQGRNRA
ncbi:MAG TPA: hypothetical protein VNP92_34640 [Actinophytocola sp.]|nr:hypothetical protein [Actinophytocola sp.]